jgi:hypothetical protein
VSERRPIVVVADDLGLRADWDTAIFAAHDFGFVNAVSVVANGPRYEWVLPGLLQRPSLEVGVHLNIYEGTPLSPPAEVPSLGMPAHVGRFLRQWLAGRIAAAEVAAEWRRQIRRLLDDGLRPLFLNSHYHLHMFPDLLEVTADLASEFAIHHVRITDEPPWRAPRPTLGVQTLPLWLLARRARPRLAARGLASPLEVRGLAASAALGLREWRAILAEPGSAPLEIVCHPGQSADQKEALESPALLDELRLRAVPFSYRS